MADWMEWLEGLSGAAAGVPKGFDVGMAPFKTWEGIRTSDLANDKSEINLRDLEAMQLAREGNLPAADSFGPDYSYYGNLVGAQDVGNRLKMAAGEGDIYGQQQELAMMQALGPGSEFQRQMQEAGLRPGSPEYRAAVAQFMSDYNPMAAVTAYDKMGIPQLQQRNLNQQAITDYIQNFVRQKDPEAIVRFAPDGTVEVVSKGEITKLEQGDLAMFAASMNAAKTPEDAIYRGLSEEQKLQLNNANMYQKYTQGGMTPALVLKNLDSDRITADRAAVNLAKELKDLRASDEYKFAATAVAREQLEAPIRERAKAIANQQRQSQMIRDYIMKTGRLPPNQSGIPPPNAAPPRPRGPVATGGSAQIAPRGTMGNRAAGRPPQQMLPSPGGMSDYEAWGM